MVPAVAECVGCGVTLCGICTDFSADGARCESCMKAFEAEQKISRESSRQHAAAMPDMTSEPADAFVAPQPRSESRYPVVQMAIIGVCVLLIAARYLLMPGTGEPADSSAAVREQVATSAVSCLLVFRQIGLQLVANQPHDPSLVCSDSPVPNRVSRDGGTVRVSHPNPEVYGFREIWVSNESPDPVLVPF